MNKIYAYCRCSTSHQRISRQVTNITKLYPSAIIIKEFYSGTTSNRPKWQKLLQTISENDTIVFDSVSRMSRNSKEGFDDYIRLYNSGINLVFLNEPHINTQVFKSSSNKMIQLSLSTGNRAIDDYFKGNIELINKLIFQLAEQQIEIAFEQSQKEVDDLHNRISQGLREAKDRGTQIGLSFGAKLTTKKSVECKETIKKHSRDFDGTLQDIDVIKLCGCTKNSYYKYKRELKESI